MTSNFLATITDEMLDRNQATAWAVFQAWTLPLDGIARVVDAGHKVLFAYCAACDASWTMSFEDRQTPIMPGTDVAAGPAQHLGYPMYNLYKAKAEIDTIARHATDLAAYVLASGRDVDAKLEHFKTEILNVIDAKFADLEHQIFGGNTHNLQTSAVDDLGAKISLLIPAPVDQITYVDHHNGHDTQHDHDSQHGHETQSYSDNNWQPSNHYN